MTEIKLSNPAEERMADAIKKAIAALKPFVWKTNLFPRSWKRCSVFMEDIYRAAEALAALEASLERRGEDAVQPIRVSQDAREAAVALFEAGGVRSASLVSNLRTGHVDDLPTVQAFARFEVQIRADEREACAKVAEDHNAATAAIAPAIRAGGRS